jgi:beta-lactamase class A
MTELMWRFAAAFIVAATLAISASGEDKSTPTDNGSDLLWKKTESRIDEISMRFDGVMGIAIVDLTDGRALLRNAEHVFPTASSIKLAILLELYRQNEQAGAGAKGKVTLDDVYTFDPKDLVEDSQVMGGLTASVTRVTNRDLAQFMVAVSDNTAANVLIDRVGKDNVNATLRGLGLNQTMMRRKMMDVAAAQRGDENVATPHEMVRLLEAIYKGKILKTESTKQLIKQLSTTKSSYIPRELPDGVQVANKPGDLGGVRTDSGIVFSPNRPFAISVMTAYASDERAAERAISEIAREAYHYFEMRGKTSEYGRILPRP